MEDQILEKYSKYRKVSWTFKWFKLWCCFCFISLILSTLLLNVLFLASINFTSLSSVKNIPQSQISLDLRETVYFLRTREYQYVNTFTLSSLSIEVPRLPGREETLWISPWETVLHQTAHRRLRSLSGFFIALDLFCIIYLQCGTPCFALTT